MQRSGGRLHVAFVELKSRRGKPSDVQKLVAAELKRVGCQWWMARSPEAAMNAVKLSGIQFLRPWQMTRLEAWEGPFWDLSKPIPSAPDVLEEKRIAQRRANARRRERRAQDRLGIREDFS